MALNLNFFKRGGPVSKQVDAPANQNTPTTPTKKPDPMEQFNALLTPKVDDKGNPITPQPKTKQPLLPIDPKKLTEQVGTLDFTSSLDPEKVKAALGGDAAAFAEVLNNAIRASTAVALQSAATFSEAAGGAAITQANAGLDDQLRARQLRDYTPKNEMFKTPAMQRAFEGMREMIANNNPTMKPDEVGAQAEAFFVQMTQNHTAEGDKGSQSGGSGTDWAQWFSDGSTAKAG